jgi:hypothetical protein
MKKPDSGVQAEIGLFASDYQIAPVAPEARSFKLTAQ